ncbi:hypothetical protein IFR05_010451 [Cadophora sp. M221]|nr:hypothetical protein IFR05_010451 [Cadophora sp. M221]
MPDQPPYSAITSNIVLKALHTGHSLDHIQRNLRYFNSNPPLWHLKKNRQATADHEKKVFWIDSCLWRHFFPGVDFTFEGLVELSPQAGIISGLANTATTKVEGHLKKALENKKMDVKEKDTRVASAPIPQTDGVQDDIEKSTPPKPNDAAGKDQPGSKAGKKPETPPLKSWADDAIEEEEAKAGRSTDKPENSNNCQSVQEAPAQYDNTAASPKSSTLSKTQTKRGKRKGKECGPQVMEGGLVTPPSSSESQTEAEAAKPDPKAKRSLELKRSLASRTNLTLKKYGAEETACVEDKPSNEDKSGAEEKSGVETKSSRAGEKSGVEDQSGVEERSGIENQSSGAEENSGVEAKAGNEDKSGTGEKSGFENTSGNAQANSHKSSEESRLASKNHADITKAQDEITERSAVPGSSYATANLPGIPEDIGSPVKTDRAITIQKNKQSKAFKSLKINSGLSHQEKEELQQLPKKFQTLSQHANDTLPIDEDLSKKEEFRNFTHSYLTTAKRITNRNKNAYQKMVSELRLENFENQLLSMDVAKLEAWWLASKQGAAQDYDLLGFICHMAGLPTRQVETEYSNAVELYLGLSDQQKFGSNVLTGFDIMRSSHSKLIGISASTSDLLMGADEISSRCMTMLEMLHEIAGDAAVYQKMVSKTPIKDCDKGILFVDLESMKAWMLKARHLYDLHQANGDMSIAGIRNDVIAWMCSDMGIEVPCSLVAGENTTSSKCPHSAPKGAGTPTSPRLAANRREPLELPASECPKPLGNVTEATNPQVITPLAIKERKIEGMVTSGLQSSGPLLLDLSLPIEELTKQVNRSLNEKAENNKLAEVSSRTEIENDEKKPQLSVFTANGTKGDTSVKEESKGEEQTWSRSTLFSALSERIDGLAVHDYDG